MLLNELTHYFTFNVRGLEMFEGITRDDCFVQGEVLEGDELDIHHDNPAFPECQVFATRKEFAVKHNLIKREG